MRQNATKDVIQFQRENVGCLLQDDIIKRERFCRSLFFLEGLMKEVFTKKWAVAALIRAARTVAQTAVATIGTAVVMSDVNWVAVVSASVLAGILSLLMSLAGLPEAEE